MVLGPLPREPDTTACRAHGTRPGCGVAARGLISYCGQRLLEITPGSSRGGTRCRPMPCPVRSEAGDAGVCVLSSATARGSRGSFEARGDQHRFVPRYHGLRSPPVLPIPAGPEPPRHSPPTTSPAQASVSLSPSPGDSSALGSVGINPCSPQPGLGPAAAPARCPRCQPRCGADCRPPALAFTLHAGVALSPLPPSP